MTAEAHSRVYHIEGLDCPDCAANLEKAVQGLPGVAEARLVYTTARLTVAPSDGDDPGPAIQKVAEAMGYTAHHTPAADSPAGAGEGAHAHAHGHVHGAHTAGDEPEARGLARYLKDWPVIASGVLLVAGFAARLLGAPQPAYDILFAAAIAVGGWPVARTGWAVLRYAHQLDINILMVIAAVGAMVVGDFAEGAVTIFLFSIGEMLEAHSGDRARNAIRSLMALAPDEAGRLRDGHEERVPVSALALGDRLIVRPGERIPMDGQVIEGQSAVNQAPITGESAPVAKGAGDTVFAGTINGGGVLEMAVTRLAGDSTLSRIMRLVQSAQAERAPAQRFVDRFAQIYTPIVVGLAVLVTLVPPLLGLGPLAVWGYRALVLLVIACPCALVISTPVTIVSALTRAARAGVLIKGGRHLETLGRVRAVALDKTGTLTSGQPRVVASGCALSDEGLVHCPHCDDLLAKAAAVESRSEHALGKAIVEYSRHLGVAERYGAGQAVTAYAGLGIEGQVDGHEIVVGSHAFCHRTHDGPNDLCARIDEAERMGYTVLVVQDRCCDNTCYFSVADTIRDGAADTVTALRREGIEHVVMLTGDNDHIATDVAGAIGIDEVRARLMPEDKVAAVEDLQSRYGLVAMVGDGVNDAPALARSSVGIAMGAAGTDTAIETADVALMGDDLARLPFAIHLSRRALRVVRANIILALGLKALFLGLAVAGIATLWMAVVADTGAIPPRHRQRPAAVGRKGRIGGRAIRLC